MKSLTSVVLLSSVFGFALVGACATRPGDDCEKFKTCESSGDGDGDGGTGGTDQGDGDGDGDSGGEGGAMSGGTGGTTDPCDECSGDTPLCNEESECVECLEAEHCLEAGASLCDAGACKACTEDADCAHIEGKNTCEAGACVECTPATEVDDCGAKSCDPATFECGPHDRASRGTCRSCVSDSDCTANHHCVPMEYPSGTAREGGYCLELSGACDNPYTVVLSERTTLSGASGESYCGINEDSATCEAVRALEDDWRCDAATPGDGHCWPATGTVDDAVVVPAALCRKFDGLAGDRCTYECAVDSQCLSPGAAGDSCGAGQAPDPITPDYCGGQDL